MTRFMRFWLRLGVVLAVPLFGWVLLVAMGTRDEPTVGLGFWLFAVIVSTIYLGLGWAIDALFSSD